MQLSPSYNPSRQLGDKLAPKLVKLISDTMISTKRGMLHTEHRARVLSGRTLIDQAGHEIADLYAPIVRDLIDHEDTPEHVRDVLREMASGRHQWKAIGGLAIGSSGVTTAISTILNNFVAQGVYAAVRRQPSLNLDAQSGAAAVAAGIIQDVDGRSNAAGWGFDSGIFDTMVQLNTSFGDQGSILQLLDREIIDEDTAVHRLRRLGMPTGVARDMVKLSEQLLSPADLADMVVRGIIEHAEGEKVAAKSGVSADDFNKLVLDTGEPPSITDLLMAFRRGFIDKARLEHGIRQSRARNEWLDVFELLRYSPMSTADAIQAYVQSHMSEGQARSIADQNGLLPDQFDALYQTAGEPISKTEVIQLLRRKIITTDIARQALAEGRLKNKYIDVVLQETRYIPPPRTIGTLYGHGALDEKQALDYLAEGGVDQTLAAAILKSQSKEKTAHVKDLTEGMLSELYESHAITRADYLAELKGLGYNEHEAEQIALIRDLRRERAEQERAITRVRASYLAHRISQQTALAKLDQLLVAPEQRDNLMKDWNIERSVNIRTLTPVQIFHAWKLQLIPLPDALSRIEQQGYTADDALLFMQVENKGAVA